MEISDVRREIRGAITRAKQAAAERRARGDEAAQEYQAFLDNVAIPLFRQAANVLRAEHFLFDVATPGGSVRLESTRSGEDYLELVLDTTGSEPRVLGRVSRARGQRRTETERPLGSGGPIRNVKEEDVLEFLTKELEPFVEK